MPDIPQVKDWASQLQREIDKLPINEDGLMKAIQRCEETAFELEPAYRYIRDQRDEVADLEQGLRRLYLTRYRKEVPARSRDELQSEEILDSPERRKNEVRRVAVELAPPGQEITDEQIFEELTARGKRFIAENPKATISTILVGFKSEFEKVEGARGAFKRRGQPDEDSRSEVGSDSDARPPESH